MNIDYYSTVVGDLDCISRVAAKLLSPQKELWDILDFSCLVETIALNDKLIFFDFDPDEDKSEERKPLEELFQPLLDEGAIEIHPFPKIDEPEIEQEVQKLSPGENVIDTANDGTAQMIVEAMNTVSAEKRFNCPGFLLTLHQPIYESHAHVVKDHEICNLSSKYVSFKETLQEFRDKSQLPKARYRTLPIPPIANFTFRKCNNIDEAVDSALYTRNKFSHLRNSLKNLREVLENDSLPPTRKHGEILSWTKSWKTLEQLTADSGYIQIADTNDYLLKGADLVIQASNSIADYKKVFAELLEQIQLLFYKWRVRSLHDIGNRYKKTPNRELNKHAERILGISIGDNEVKDLVETIDIANQFKMKLRLVPCQEYNLLRSVADMMDRK